MQYIVEIFFTDVETDVTNTKLTIELLTEIEKI